MARHGVRSDHGERGLHHRKIEEYFAMVHGGGVEIGYSYEGSWTTATSSHVRWVPGGMRRIQDFPVFDETTLVVCGTL